MDVLRVPFLYLMLVIAFSSSASELDKEFIKCLPDDVDGVEHCLKKGVNPNMLLEDSFSHELITPLLMYGFKQCYEELTQKLLQYKAHIAACDSNGDTLLHRVIERNFLSQENEPFIVRTIGRLKDYKIDINIKNKAGQTALVLVCDRTSYFTNLGSQYRVVEMLLESGADPTIGYQNEKNYITPLFNVLNGFNVIYNEYIDLTPLVHLLIRKGVRPTRNDLLIASKKRYCPIEVVTFLIDNGADVNETDGRGYTLLHEFAEGTNEPVLDYIQLFLDSGAKKEIVSYDGLIPLDIARRSKSESVQKYKKDVGEKEWVDNIIKVHDKVIRMLAINNEPVE